MTELLHHVGAVYRHVAIVIRQRPITGVEVRGNNGPVPSPGLEMADWFRAATDELVMVIGDVDAGEPAWSWSPNATVGFWARRMCHEVLVHQWDAATAFGEATEIEPMLADDGVDEFLTEFVPLMRRRRRDRAAHGERFALQSTDTESTWIVVLGENESTVGCAADRSGLADATLIRGQAQDLLLRLWRRPSTAEIEVSPDAGLDRWFELVGCP